MDPEKKERSPIVGKSSAFDYGIERFMRRKRTSGQTLQSRAGSSLARNPPDLLFLGGQCQVRKVRKNTRI